jgi:hypothetical protein
VRFPPIGAAKCLCILRNIDALLLIGASHL